MTDLDLSRPARAGRRRVRALRRAASIVALLAPTLWFVGSDFARRTSRILAFDRIHAIGYAGSIACAAVVWCALVYAASGRRRRLGSVAGVLFALLFVLPAGVQGGYYALFHQYYSLDGGAFVESLPWVYLGSLPPRAIVFFHFALALGVAVGIVAFARKVVRPRRIPARLRPIVLLPVLGLPLSGAVTVSYRGHQSTTAELIYFEGVSWITYDRYRRTQEHDPLLVRVQGRHPPSLPKIAAAPAQRRNVLFILQEAQRADVTCSGYEPDCAEANVATNELLPERMPLLSMRANASSTFIAFQDIFAGLDPTESSERLHAAPMVWELAHAAGYDTAFWTNQTPYFATYRLFFQDLPLSHFCTGTELDPTADWLTGAGDDLLTDRVIHDFGKLEEPFFAAVQYSNIHYPRIFDAEHAPFQPSDPDYLGETYRNYYKNVVYLSDRSVARLIEHVRGTESGSRTVIVYSSDHGESFYEHQNDNFHGGTLFDEEIQVPAWIDAPPGTLTPDEERSVLGKRDAPLFQLDLCATFLDLLGLWDAPGVAPFRARMLGRPITRPELRTGPMPLTNVSWVWEYWLPNWGLMDWPLKIMAGPTDTAYECYDLEADPRETKDLGEERCAPLVKKAKAIYGMMPVDLHGHLKDRPSWAAR
jgi:hypothetical protein